MYICSLGAELFYYGVALSSDCNPAFDFTAVKAVCTHMTVAEIHVYIQVTIQVTLGQIPTFYPEIPLILIFQKCEFCDK